MVALTTVELVGTVVAESTKVDVVSVATVVSTPGATVGKFESGASFLNSTFRHSPGSPPGALPNTLIIESISTTFPASTGWIPSFDNTPGVFEISRQSTSHKLSRVRTSSSMTAFTSCMNGLYSVAVRIITGRGANSSRILSRYS